MFCSGDYGCKNGCIYCFSSWQNEKLFSSFNSISLDNFSILYPVCDSEISYQNNLFWKQMLKKLEELTFPAVICLSSKCYWDDDKLEDIVRYNSSHASTIKLAVSFSAMENLDIIEPNASSFSERVNLLKRIISLGIPTNILLKPILPFVTLDEYKSLVDVCSTMSKNFVIGGLYVDKNSDFFKEFICDKYRIVKRYSTWLKKELDYVEHPQYNELVSYINKIGCKTFESDYDYVKKTIIEKGELE